MSIAKPLPQFGHGEDAALSSAGDLLNHLLDASLWMRSGAPGVFSHGATYVRLKAGLSQHIARFPQPVAERFSFGPLMAQADLYRAGYYQNFGNLVGVVHCYCGDEGQHWTSLSSGADASDDEGFQASGLALTPAACYPAYPILASRGPLASEGICVHVSTPCFRREPSQDPTRLQTFEMQEYVFAGAARRAESIRTQWMHDAKAWIDALELPFELSVAHDPFFGRAAQLMTRSQSDQALKYELLVQIHVDGPTAVMSFNLHRDKLARAFGVRLDGGEGDAHTACMGFGVDRLALALIARHGVDPDCWPAPVRRVLRWTN